MATNKKTLGLRKNLKLKNIDVKFTLALGLRECPGKSQPFIPVIVFIFIEMFGE